MRGRAERTSPAYTTAEASIRPARSFGAAEQQLCGRRSDAKMDELDIEGRRDSDQGDGDRVWV